MLSGECGASQHKVVTSKLVIKEKKLEKEDTARKINGDRKMPSVVEE